MAIVPGSRRSHRPVGCRNHRSGLLDGFSGARSRSCSPRITASSQHSARRLRSIPGHCLWGDRSRYRPFCDRLRLSCGLCRWRPLRGGRAHHGRRRCIRRAGVANHIISITSMRHEEQANFGSFVRTTPWPIARSALPQCTEIAGSTHHVRKALRIGH